MITSYIWLVLFIGLILLLTNRHLIPSPHPSLSPNGHHIIEVIQRTYQIEEIDLIRSIHHEKEHQLIIKLINYQQLPEPDLLNDLAAHIASQVKEALQHPEDFKSCKVLFVTRQGKNYEVHHTIALEHIFS